MSTRKSVTVALAAAFVLLMSVPLSAWAQAGRITGTVVNAQTLDPVETAQVYIPGTRIGTLTDNEGGFTLIVVPAGRYEVRCEIIGYRTESQTITVGAGETQVVEFQLEPSVLRLQELVVTGTAARMPRAKLPFTVERIDLEDMPVPAVSAEMQLHAKAAGVRVVKGSGEPGDEASILLRAPTSIRGDMEPLVIIDGVVTWNTLADIDALDIESVEIVKGAAAASLYGAVAANGVIQITTRRGAGLQAGENQITVRNEYGAQSIEGSIPLQRNTYWAVNEDGSSFVNDAGEDINYGDPGMTMDALWEEVIIGTDTITVDPTTVTFQDKDFPGPTYDHLDRFFDPGEFYSNHVAVMGKTANTNYRASFTNQREEGVVMFHDGYKRRNARINVDHEVWDNLTLSLGGYYAWAWQDETPGNNPFFDLTFLPPNVDLLACGEWEYTAFGAGGEPTDSTCLHLVTLPDPLNNEEDNPIHTLKERERTDQNSRVMGSIFARYAPFPWLDIEASFGLDRNDWHRTTYTPRDMPRARGGPDPGSLYKINQASNNTNASLTASLHRQLGDFILRGQARYLFEDRHFEEFDAYGSDLGAFDVPDLGVTSTSGRDITSQIRDINSDSYYLIGEADYKGKYIVDALIRWDGSSLFGPDERWQTYNRISLAWRPSQEPWWFLDPVGEFKLRFSRGTAGGRPQFSAQYETYDVEGGVITPENLGNKQLKPEYAVEYEYGLDLVALDRFNFVLNYSDQETEDALLYVPLPGVLGYQNQWQNAATIEGTTWEATLEAALADRPEMTWTARLSFDRSRNTITDLNQPPYRRGPNGEQMIQKGEGLGTFYGHRWATRCDELPADVQPYCDGTAGNEFQVNDDGYLVWVGDGYTYRDGITQQRWGLTTDLAGQSYRWGMPFYGLECQRRTAEGDFELLPAAACEEELDPAKYTSQHLHNFLRIGDSTPDFAWSFSSNFRWKGLNVYALLDAEVGHDIYFHTGQWAMRELGSGIVDEKGTSDELKKPIGYYATMYDVNESNSFYVTDGTYLKLREVAVSYTFRQDQLPRFFGGFFQRATVQLIGRNLFTFTDFPGYDPEVGSGNAAVERTDSYGYPNYRTYTAMLELVF